MKERLIICLFIIAVQFSCNGGQDAGTHSHSSPPLTPNPSGASRDTTRTKGDTNNRSNVDTSAAALPTDTAVYKRGATKPGSTR